MKVTDLYITATEARNNFFNLLEKVKKSPYPINVTVKGVPEVVMMSKEDYEGWMATVETLSDPELMESIRKGDEDIRAGNYSSLEEVIQELGTEKLSISDKKGKKYVSSPAHQSRKKRHKKVR